MTTQLAQLRKMKKAIHDLKVKITWMKKQHPQDDRKTIHVPTKRLQLKLIALQKEYRKEYQRQYSKSYYALHPEIVIRAVKKYNKTEKGIRSRSKYNESDRNKARQKRYEKTEKARRRHAKYKQKHQ